MEIDRKGYALSIATSSCSHVTKEQFKLPGWSPGRERRRLITNNTTWVIRWDKEIEFENGDRCYMECFGGTREEAEEYANRMAEEQGAVVKAIA